MKQNNAETWEMEFWNQHVDPPKQGWDPKLFMTIPYIGDTCYTTAPKNILWVSRWEALQTEIIKRKNTRTHVCAFFFQNLRKIWILECKTGKTGTFSYFGFNLTKFFQILYVFMATLVHNFAQNYIKLNSDGAKKFTFRVSVYSYSATREGLLCLGGLEERESVDTPSKP